MEKIRQKAAVVGVRIGVLLVLGATLFLIRKTASTGFVFPELEATAALGFILIGAYICGKLSEEVQLPLITGYILAGVVFGPFVLDLISTGSVDKLQLLDNLALGLIALTAGGELRISKVKERLKSIVGIASFQTLIVFFGMTLCLFGLQYLYDPFEVASRVVWVAISMLISVTATANSPATVIAIITETDSEGDLTDTVLGVTIIKDVLVIALFAVVLSFSRVLVYPDSSFDMNFIFSLTFEVAGSLIIGALIGYLITLYLKHVEGELILFIFAVAFIAMEFAQIKFHLGVDFHLSGLLICMTAGFYVSNFSDAGRRFIHYLEKGSMPVYVLFFTIAGAALDLNALRDMWKLAVFLAAGRVITTFAGTWFGAKTAGDGKYIKYFSWTAFVAQAGVTVGFAVIITQRFPEWGNTLATAIMAALALNQLIGPPLFKYALDRTGESTR